MTKKSDMVNHPSHYNTGKIEVIDAIEDWGLDFCEGNVIKYVARAKHKGNELEDLNKAHWYLERLIERKMIEKHENPNISPKYPESENGNKETCHPSLIGNGKYPGSDGRDPSGRPMALNGEVAKNIAKKVREATLKNMREATERPRKQKRKHRRLSIWLRHLKTNMSETGGLQSE